MRLLTSSRTGCDCGGASQATVRIGFRLTSSMNVVPRTRLAIDWERGDDAGFLHPLPDDGECNFVRQTTVRSDCAVA